MPVPAAWGSAEADIPAKAPLLARWWQRLGDPQLDALIAEAVTANLDVATPKARVREARASYREAGGAPSPPGEGARSANRTRNGTAHGGRHLSGPLTPGLPGPLATYQSRRTWGQDMSGQGTSES